MLHSRYLHASKHSKELTKNDQLAQYTNKINLTRTRSIVEVGQHREFDNGKNIWANRTLEIIEPATVMHFPMTIWMQNKKFPARSINCGGRSIVRLR